MCAAGRLYLNRKSGGDPKVSRRFGLQLMSYDYSSILQ